jgi:hypothetical protein
VEYSSEKSSVHAQRLFRPCLFIVPPIVPPIAPHCKNEPRIAEAKPCDSCIDNVGESAVHTSSHTRLASGDGLLYADRTT